MKTNLFVECDRIINGINKKITTNKLKVKLVNAPAYELSDIFYNFMKEKTILLIRLDAMKYAFKKHIKNKKQLALIKQAYYEKCWTNDLFNVTRKTLWSLCDKILESYKCKVMENMIKLF